MKAKKLLIVCLALVMVATLITAVACDDHTHEYTEWGKDATQHWKVCPEDGEIDESTKADHSYGADGKCECGAEQSVVTPEHECDNKCEECGKCLTEDCDHKACEEKCLGHGSEEPEHECQNPCPTCGGCLTEDCEHEACTDKCTCEPEPTMHTVTFLANGETYLTETVEHGHTVSAPTTNPVHSTKTFHHWADESYEVYDFDSPVNDDLTLEASFYVYVDFDINGATGTAPDGIWGNSISATVTMPDATGLTNGDLVFGGWTDGDTTYQAGAIQRFTASATLTAVWNSNSQPEPDVKKYTITFEYQSIPSGVDAEDITGTLITIADAAEGETVTIPTELGVSLLHFHISTFRPTQYVVSGGDGSWVNIQGATALGGSFTMPAGNVKVYLVWAGNDVTISFDANGGTGEKASITRTYNSNISFTTGSAAADFNNTFTGPNGAAFLGWSNSANGFVLENGTKLDSRVVSADDTLTLYAIWNKTTVTPEPEPESAIEAIVGKWTSDASVVVISTIGADGELYVGSIIYKGEYILLMQLLNGGFLGYTSKEDAKEDDAEPFIITVGDGTITIDEITYSNRQDLITSVTLQDFNGSWTRSDTNQKLTIDAGSDNITVGSSASATYIIIDEYLVLTYSGEYRYVLSIESNQLEGFYTAPGADPKAVTFDFDEHAVEQPTDKTLADYQGIWIAEGTIDIDYSDMDAAKIEGNKIYFREEGDEDFYWDYELTEDKSGPYLIAKYEKINSIFQTVMWSFTITFTADNKFTIEVSTSSGASVEFTKQESGNEEDDNQELTYTGSATYTKSVMFQGTTTYEFTKFVVDFDNKQVTYTVSVNGNETTKTVSMSDNSSSRYKPEGSGAYYEIVAEGTSFYLSFSTDNSTLIMCDSDDGPIEGSFTKA